MDSSQVHHSCHNLVQLKKVFYLKSKIHSVGSNARPVWRTVDNLLGETKSGAKPTFSMEDYHFYIDKNVAHVRLRACQCHRCSTLEIRTGQFQDLEHWRCYNGGHSFSQQTVCVRPFTKLTHERSHYHPRILHHKNFQLVDYWGKFVADMKECYFYATIEESWAGQVFSIKLSSGFKFSTPFESPRKDCQSSTYRLPQRVSLASRCSVVKQMMPLNVNRWIEVFQTLLMQLPMAGLRYYYYFI